MAATTSQREIEGRDSVGLYLDEIARTPLLDAITEVELAKTIEAGLLAEHLLAEGRIGRRKGGAPAPQRARLSSGAARAPADRRAGRDDEPAVLAAGSAGSGRRFPPSILFRGKIFLPPITSWRRR